MPKQTEKAKEGQKNFGMGQVLDVKVEKLTEP
jgi:hypothetical protein